MYTDKLVSILLDLRTPDNAHVVDSLLNKLNQMTDDQISEKLEKIGTTDDQIRTALDNRIQNMMNKEKYKTKEYPLNDMFYYGLSGDSAHIHLVPKDLHHLLEKGPEYLVDTVNLYMLDAIDKLKNLKLDEDPRFVFVSHVYMITPMYHSPTFEKANELEFLRSLLFRVNSYSPENLQDNEYLKTHPEAQLAKDIFGDQKKVATAIIGIDTLAGEEWQTLKEAKFEEYRKKGLTLPDAQDHEDR